jgi:hypothetical protein
MLAAGAYGRRVIEDFQPLSPRARLDGILGNHRYPNKLGYHTRVNGSTLGP